MSALLLGAAVLAWGFSWFAITFQLGPAAPEVSIALRFTLAGVLLSAGLRWLGRWHAAPWSAHWRLAGMGACLFSVNFWCFYLAMQYMASGVASVLFSTAALFGAANQWLLLGVRPSPRVVAGAALGVAGIGALFADALASLGGRDALLGVGLAALGTYVFSLGNLLSVRVSQVLDVPNATARSMLYGGVICIGIALLRDASFTIAWTPAYLASLAYLVVVASIGAFVAYLTLVNRVGPARAAYATVLFPVVALSVSSIAEGYRWTPSTALGVALVLGGVVLVFLPGRVRQL